MRSLVDIEMCLLIETLGTILDCALITLLATLGASLFLNILLYELGIDSSLQNHTLWLGKEPARKEGYGRHLPQVYSVL